MAFLRKRGGLWSVLFGRDQPDIAALLVWPNFGGGEAIGAFLRDIFGPL